MEDMCLLASRSGKSFFYQQKTKSKKAFAETRYEEGGTKRLKETIHFLLWLAAEKSAAAHWQGTVTSSK